MAATESSTDATRGRSRPVPTGWIAALLFVALVVVYESNGSAVDEGDSVSSTNLPVALIEHGTFSFTVDYFPQMFKWKTDPPLKYTEDLFFRSWEENIQGRAARDWWADGIIHENGHRYYLVESPVRKVLVSTFGPLPGLTFLPMFAVMHSLDPEAGDKFNLMLSAGKLHAAMMIAAVAVILFLIAMRFTSRSRALLVAVAYGLGTGAWAISSQALWQQSVNTFFLCLGAVCFVVGAQSRLWAALAGLAFGTAVAVRPTSILVYAGVALFLALYHRRSLLPFLVASTPTPIGIAIYNNYYFGSPFTFAQELVGHVIATEKTGVPDLWQTPFFEGLYGLLFCPSRGLMIFSPFMAFALWGLWRIWRNPTFARLRPLSVGALLMMALQCKWFDWWGGWTYGYRPWLDVIPIVSLFLVPVIDSIRGSRVLSTAFAALLLWSMFVQGVGAFYYDRTWNDRKLHVVRVPGERKPRGLFTYEEAMRLVEEKNAMYVGITKCDIDMPHCRHRLWSFEDNMIRYYVQFHDETRHRRYPSGWKEFSAF